MDPSSIFWRRAQADPLTLVAFYDGSGVDSRGRGLQNILSWGADRLEASHDYIQILFPLPEASGVNGIAPVINEEVFKAFRSSSSLRAQLREAFKKILWFYGFRLVEEDGVKKVVKAADYQEYFGNWNTRFDHNHLRITRIIRSLRVLGLEEEAEAFYGAMRKNGTRVSSMSRMYWKRAARRQLNIPPDMDDEDADEDDERIGRKFLYRFEIERRAAKASPEEHDAAQAPEKTTKSSEQGMNSMDTDRGAADEVIAPSRKLEEDGLAPSDLPEAKKQKTEPRDEA
ncbi:opioid growth factor receptor conserved region-domain-containing protein [Bisporella sp. PMI_857]|nr:opioid growth factor receptor conserved region-domain-containing protein [Bisporella sp. PMI_857]